MSASPSTSEPRTVRVGLVGYGDAGRGIHARLLDEAGLPIVMVATANPDRVERVRAERPGTAVVGGLEALLERRGEVDVVVLATATAAHADQVIACAEAGVPVVVEKPLGVDAASAERAVQASEAAGVPLTVFHNRRLDAEQLTLTALVASGELGEVFRLERRWERWRPVPRQRWREDADPAMGGGLVLDLQSHLVDSATQLLGPVTHVYADLAARTTRAEDDAFLVLTHAGGARSHLSALSLAGAPGPRTRALGTGGAYLVGPYEAETSAFESLSAPDGHTGWLVRGEQREPVPTAPGGHADFYRAVAAALGDPATAGGSLAARSARQATMPVPPADALAVVEVLDAARASSAARQVVALG